MYAFVFVHTIAIKGLKSVSSGHPHTHSSFLRKEANSKGEHRRGEFSWKRQTDTIKSNCLTALLAIGSQTYAVQVQ